jgi:acyl-coenzyme A thioesterase PaaI-like protein
MSMEESMPDHESAPEYESEPPAAEADTGAVDWGVKTHPKIDAGLCGVVTHRAPGEATVLLATTEAMVADARGLVHGGFVFGAADFAAMVAVNDPNVVLGAAETRFTAPVEAGDAVVCKATIETEKGRKRSVQVDCTVNGRTVLEGRFTTFVLDHHVLDPSR